MQTCIMCPCVLDWGCMGRSLKLEHHPPPISPSPVAVQPPSVRPLPTGSPCMQREGEHPHFACVAKRGLSPPFYVPPCSVGHVKGGGSSKECGVRMLRCLGEFEGGECSPPGRRERKEICMLDLQIPMGGPDFQGNHAARGRESQQY